MADLEDWRVFIREMDDLSLARAVRDLRDCPEDKDYLDEVLRELGRRYRRRVGDE